MHFHSTPRRRFVCVSAIVTVVAVGVGGCAVAALSAGAAFSATPERGSSISVGPPGRLAGSTVARLVYPTTARVHPGAGRVVDGLTGETGWSHEPQYLLVLGSARHGGREWLKVLLPVRPVGAAGWIPRDLAVLGHSDLWIVVRKRSRQLLVYRHGVLVRRARVVIGAPATPTPSGLAAIYERNRQPGPDALLGPWALPLTALSRVLHHFDGGPGRIAIHGRGKLPGLPGAAASAGCIRVADRMIRWLATHVPPGTPVRIEG